MPAVPSNAIASGQVTVLTAGIQIAPARSDRKRLTLTMVGAVDVFIGPTSGVLSTTGAMLTGTKGTTLVLETTAAVFGISGSSAVVSYLEEFA